MPIKGYLEGLEEQQEKLIVEAEDLIDKIFHPNSLKPKDIPQKLRQYYSKRTQTLNKKSMQINEIIAHVKGFQDKTI